MNFHVGVSDKTGFEFVCDCTTDSVVTGAASRKVGENVG